LAEPELNGDWTPLDETLLKQLLNDRSLPPSIMGMDGESAKLIEQVQARINAPRASEAAEALTASEPEPLLIRATERRERWLTFAYTKLAGVSTQAGMFAMGFALALMLHPAWLGMAAVILAMGAEFAPYNPLGCRSKAVMDSVVMSVICWAAGFITACGILAMLSWPTPVINFHFLRGG
jgi:hypothetical protein